MEAFEPKQADSRSVCLNSLFDVYLSLSPNPNLPPHTPSLHKPLDNGLYEDRVASTLSLLFPNPMPSTWHRVAILMDGL